MVAAVAVVTGASELVLSCSALSVASRAFFSCTAALTSVPLESKLDTLNLEVLLAAPRPTEPHTTVHFSTPQFMTRPSSQLQASRRSDHGNRPDAPGSLVVLAAA